MKTCPYCAEQIQDGAIVCKHCQNSLPKTLPNKTQPSTLSVFLNNHKTGVLITVSAVIAFGFVVDHFSPGSGNPQPAQPTPVVANQSNSPVPTPTSQVIPYEIVSQWNITNGGVGEDIVIPPTYLNQTDMTALGETLKNDFLNDRNAFITVFTDKKAAAMKDEVASTDATQAELDFYDSHHVAAYTKNGSTGYNTYDFGLTGFGGANDTVINY